MKKVLFSTVRETEFWLKKKGKVKGKKKKKNANQQTKKWPKLSGVHFGGLNFANFWLSTNVTLIPKKHVKTKGIRVCYCLLNSVAEVTFLEEELWCLHICWNMLSPWKKYRKNAIRNQLLTGIFVVLCIYLRLVWRQKWNVSHVKAKKFQITAREGAIRKVSCRAVCATLGCSSCVQGHSLIILKCNVHWPLIVPRQPPRKRFVVIIL